MRFPSTRSFVTALALTGALFAATLPELTARAETSAAERASLSWERDKKDPHWVHGRVDVATAPDAVWDRIQNVEQWPRLFGDIKWLKVKEHKENRWRLRLETHTMNCGAHDYIVVLDPKARSGTLRIDAPGIDSTARLLVQPGTGAVQSNVAYSLYVRATGIMGWFISEQLLRQKQEQMVDRNLRDLEKAFGVPARS